MYRVTTLLGLILTLAFLAGAFISYPGSTYYNPHSSGYNLWENTISEAGMTVNYRHEPLPTSRTFFTLALLGMAATVSTFFFNLARSTAQKTLAIGAGLLFLLIPLVPSDLHREAHNYTFFTAVVATWICIAFSVRNGFRTGLWVPTLGLLTLYIPFLIAYPSTTISPTIHLVHVISQKTALVFVAGTIFLELRRKQPQSITASLPRK